MEAELATMFSPEMATSLRIVQQDCEKCMDALGINKQDIE